jgi:hypothetical protein
MNLLSQKGYLDASKTYQIIDIIFLLRTNPSVYYQVMVELQNAENVSSFFLIDRKTLPHHPSIPGESGA